MAVSDLLPLGSECHQLANQPIIYRQYAVLKIFRLSSYEIRLHSTWLLGVPEYTEFHDVIGVMLAEKAKLEQEAFLL
jgi:hypothetical protein